jgi:uncharacterized protein
VDVLNDETENGRLFAEIIGDSPVIDAVLGRWHAIALPDCWLVAGALAQTVWNRAFGFGPHHGISDIDLVYFDGSDLSEYSEAQHAARIRGLFRDLEMKIDVKNEARVHLWYEQKFGYDIEPYTSTTHAISTFPTTATAVGVRPAEEKLAIAAPFGLDDLLGLVVRPNKVQITRVIYEAKAARWRALWPQLAILPWEGA